MYNNNSNTPEQKSNEKKQINFGIFLFLGLIIIGLSSYIITDKILNSNNSTTEVNENKNDKTKTNTENNDTKKDNTEETTVKDTVININDSKVKNSMEKLGNALVALNGKENYKITDLNDSEKIAMILCSDNTTETHILNNKSLCWDTGNKSDLTGETKGYSEAKIELMGTSLFGNNTFKNHVEPTIKSYAYMEEKHDVAIKGTKGYFVAGSGFLSNDPLYTVNYNLIKAEENDNFLKIELNIILLKTEPPFTADYKFSTYKLYNISNLDSSIYEITIEEYNKNELFNYSNEKTKTYTINFEKQNNEYYFYSFENNN
jgi:hypothetical protein